FSFVFFVLLLFFFFSSRRRHTRCLSDWSSDVCSSDLGVTRSGGRCAGHSHEEKSGRQERTDNGVCSDPAIEFTPVIRRPFLHNRSEERRVGKECRSRGSQYH